MSVKLTNCREQQDGYFCTQGAQTLPGDSGGAFTFEREGKTYLAGMTVSTSCSYRCGTERSCKKDELPLQLNLDLRADSDPFNEAHLLTYYPSCRVSSDKSAEQQIRRFNYYIIYRLFLIRNNIYKLTNEQIESRWCENIRNHTAVKSSTFTWKGKNIKFEAVVTKVKGSKRKFVIQEGYNGHDFVFYISRYGNKLFEIRQPNRKLFFEI